MSRISAELDAVLAQVYSLPRQPGENFRAVLPLNPLHERVFRAQAMLWRALEIEPLMAWPAGLWDPLPLFQAPPRQGKATVNVVMMQNEYRAGAFNLSNAGDKPLFLRAQITGLRGGVNPPYLIVHEVVWTDSCFAGGIMAICSV